MCGLRASRLCTGFRCFLLEFQALVHTFRIVLSGNDAPKIIPDKSLGNGLVFKMAVAVNLWTWISHFAWHRHGLEKVHKAWPQSCPFCYQKKGARDGRTAQGWHLYSS